MQVFIAIRQKPDFQSLDQFLDVLLAGEHGRDHHQRAGVQRNSCGTIHSGQGVRRNQHGCQPVHQRNCQLTAGQQRQDADGQQ